jgi:hypothetical protein
MPQDRERLREGSDPADQERHGLRLGWQSYNGGEALGNATCCHAVEYEAPSVIEAMARGLSPIEAAGASTVLASRIVLHLSAATVLAVAAST